MSEKESQATVLIALCQDEGVRLIHDSEGNAFAILNIDGVEQTHSVRSKNFRRWLANVFYQEMHSVPNSQAMADATIALEGKAIFQGDNHDVCLRVGGNLDRIVIDPGWPDWQKIVVDGNGWRVGKSEILFRRSKGLLSLPVPAKGGNLNELRRLLNVDDDGWRLIVGWMLAALRPIGPYPVLILSGEQGTAKSTTCRVLRALIDQNKAPLRSPPRNERDLLIAASNGWAVCLENLTDVPGWLSDALCRLATGGGFSTRELFSDGDEIIFDAQRPAMLNGIGDFINRSDLLDRALMVTLQPIPESKRRPESEFWQDFDSIKNRVLGCLLDALSGAVRNHQTVHLNDLPRMADFAIWMNASETSLGWKPGEFNRAYKSNRQSADEQAIEGSIFGQAIRRLAEDDDFEGNASQLLNRLNERTPEPDRKIGHDWPKNARQLSSQLRRIAPNLRRLGVSIDFDGPRRQLAIRKLSQNTVRTVQTVFDPQKDAIFDARSAHGLDSSCTVDARSEEQTARSAHGLRNQGTSENAAKNGVSHGLHGLHGPKQRLSDEACPRCKSQIVESVTFDGFINRNCSGCGKSFQCRKAN